VEYDYALNNASVLDGTGNPAYHASIAISGGKISRISPRPLHGKVTISCDGLTVCPGFIDIHSHSDVVPLAEQTVKRKMTSEKVMQGVTTEVNGNCSFSAAPLSDAHVDLLKDFMEPLGHFKYDIAWTTYAEYLTAIERAGLATNFVGLVGHGTLRIAVMGMQGRKADADEKKKMSSLLDDALNDGAFGLSTGLLYTPGSYADPSELIELCKVVAARYGIVTSHLRDYGDNLERSINEALNWSRSTGVRLQISHCMVVGQANWGTASKAVALIEKARAEQLDVAFDQYPYTAGMTDLRAALPPWMADGGPEDFRKRLQDPEARNRAGRDMTAGLESWESISRNIGWDNVVIGFCEGRKDLEGKSVSHSARESGKSSEDFVFDLLLTEPTTPLIVIHMMNENDVRLIMRHPLQMFGTDGIPTTGKTHPRTLGSYPRILSKFVKEESVLTVQDAVRRMTSFPASRVGLRDRGIVTEGLAADLVVFDHRRIKDRATFDEPNQYPEGIEHVFVNGVPAVRDGSYQASYSGRVLKPTMSP
jgi:N-acyl-D-aspartate/D-glutamate deacylase